MLGLMGDELRIGLIFFEDLIVFLCKDLQLIQPTSRESFAIRHTLAVFLQGADDPKAHHQSEDDHEPRKEDEAGNQHLENGEERVCCIAFAAADFPHHRREAGIHMAGDVILRRLVSHTHHDFLGPAQFFCR